jgi:hypothetical protein
MSKNALILMAIPLTLLLGCDGPYPAEPAADLTVAEAPSFAKGGNGQGLVRSTWPTDDDPGGPFYARIVPIPPHVYIDGGWAAIPFYRDPACLLANRPAFNLLQFFDPPFAFLLCEDMTVQGFSLWHGAVGNGAPHTVVSEGAGAVPVWFVPEQEILDAMSDGVLTIVELAGLPGLLVGYATFFSEMLQPHPNPPELGGGGHPVPKIVLNSRGTLEDGRRFDFRVTSVADQDRSVRIQFR